MEDNKPKISYETLWKFIIRPPRDEYDEELLGHSVFTYKHKQYQRKDYEIISSEGYLMKCSFVEPIEECRPSIEMPVVLYLHGNSSSRLEGLNNLDVLLKHNINLFVIDFPGCGLSEGEYISLGYHEKDDVKILIDFIENIPGVSKIGLWGRSMGAATTLLYTYKDPRISAICVDSPFEKFKKLAEELVVKQINLPKLIIDGALKIVQGTVKKKNGLDIYKLKPIENVANTYQPALFIHAINDELINVEHSINLFNNYGGPKSLKCCDKGGHNTKRPKNVKNEIGNFFYKYLCTNESEKEEKEAKTIHNYQTDNNLNNINSIEGNDEYEYEYDYDDEYQNIDDIEYDELNNIYEEDYIVSQIIQSQNGGKKGGDEKLDKNTKASKSEDNIKNEEKVKNKKRIEKKIKEEKMQMEQMKEAFMSLKINNNKENNNNIGNYNNINNDDNNNNNIDNNLINKSENNIINENNNEINNFNNNENDIDNEEEECKNNSNSPKSIENGGKFGF